MRLVSKDIDPRVASPALYKLRRAYFLRGNRCINRKNPTKGKNEKIQSQCQHDEMYCLALDLLQRRAIQFMALNVRLFRGWARVRASAVGTGQFHSEMLRGYEGGRHASTSGTSITSEARETRGARS